MVNDWDNNEVIEESNEGAENEGIEEPIAEDSGDVEPKEVDGDEPKGEGGAEGGVSKDDDAVAAPKTFKLKIDGEDIEASEEQIIRMAQMSASSHRRFEDASKMSKSSKLILEAAKKDPIKFLTHPELGLSKGEVRAALETYLGEQIMYEQMTEDQKRSLDNERKVKAFEEQETTRKQQEERQKQQHAIAHYQQDYEKQFLGALETVKIPKTPETVSRMASYMNKAVSKGIELNATQAAKLVKEDYSNEFNSLFSNMDAEKLAGFIGEGNLKKLRTRDKKTLLKNNINPSNSDNIKTTSRKKSMFAEPDSFANYLDSIENS